jgi:hypothetical protein
MASVLLNKTHAEAMPELGARLLGGTALTSCPLCGQLLPNDAEGARIHANLDADERARQRQWEADRLAARSEGIAAAQPQIAALNENIIAMGETMDATVAERVEQKTLMIEARVGGEMTMKNQEIERLNKKIVELNRLAAQQTANKLGEMGELEVYNGLKAARPEDRIKRTSHGSHGADITVEFMHANKSVGTALVEVKNTTRWMEGYVSKLQQDALDAKADWAVCVTAAFPPGTRPQPMAHKAILLCPPDSVVPFMQILRDASIKLHAAKAAGKDADTAKGKIYELIAGKGRRLLQSVAAGGARLKELDQELLIDVTSHVKKSGKIIDAQAQNLGDFTTAVDDIISGNDDGEDIS